MTLTTRTTRRILLGLIFLIVAHCSLRNTSAQCDPGTVRFPGALDTVDSLFQVADSPLTTLAVAISSGSATITVPANGTAKFPSSGSIKIDGEIIYYCSKTSSTFTSLTRGAGGTAATAHALNAQIRSPILAVHHNTLASSLVATQTKLGFGSSVPALNRVFFGTGAGASSWVAQPAIDCTNCINLPSAPVSSVFGRTGAVVAVTNDYTWAQINKAISSLADIATRSATDLSSGTLPDARFPATLPALNGSNLTALNASNLGTGTVPDARFPATLPAINGVNITGINGSNIASGTVPIARGGTGQATGTAAFNALDPLTTKGDVIAHNGSDSIRIPVGSNGQVLTADSAQSAGIKWATPSGITNSAASGVLMLSDGTNAVGSGLNYGGGNLVPTNPVFNIGDAVTGTFLRLQLTGTGPNQLHAHPNDLMIDTTGVVYIGDYGASNGNETGIKISDAADLSVRINAYGQVVIGDVAAAANGTKLTVDDPNKSITLAAVTTKLTPVVFADLPTCNSGSLGAVAIVTDSTVNTWGSTIAGGSANKVMAFCNGANWTVFGN